jgi:hypothetical protein
MVRRPISLSLAALMSSRHVYMIVAEVATLLLYIISIAFLPEYFGAWFLHRGTTFLTIVQIYPLCLPLDSPGR